MLYWVLKYVVVGPLIRLLLRPWVKGKANFLRRGPAILVSNHLSFSDSVVVWLAVPRRVTCTMKAEYFTTGGFLGRVMAWFFRSMGQVPIDRTGGTAGGAALDLGAEVLANGGLYGFYPEGTRTPDGRLYKGHTGAARLALRTGVPVLPLAMIDTDKMQPIGTALPNLRFRPGVIFGKPLDFSRYRGRDDDRALLRSVTHEIMQAIQALSGQEYIDVYASDVKAGRSAGSIIDGQ